MKKILSVLFAIMLVTSAAYAVEKYFPNRDNTGTIGKDTRSWSAVWGNTVVMEGATQDAYETTITPTDATADRTITLPNATGTVALTVGDGALVASEVVTATNVLTSAECGTTYYLDSATEFQTTLPAISTLSAGCKFRFYVQAAPASASYTIITGNSLENVVTGGVVERETDTNDDGPYQAAGDTITFVDGVSVAGDFIELEYSGTIFYMTGQVNADGGLTIAQAD